MLSFNLGYHAPGANFWMEDHAGPDFRICMSIFRMKNLLGKDNMKPWAMAGLGEIGIVISFSSALFISENFPLIFFLFFEMDICLFPGIQSPEF